MRIKLDFEYFVIGNWQRWCGRNSLEGGAWRQTITTIIITTIIITTIITTILISTNQINISFTSATEYDLASATSVAYT